MFSVYWAVCLIVEVDFLGFLVLIELWLMWMCENLCGVYLNHTVEEEDGEGQCDKALQVYSSPNQFGQTWNVLNQCGTWREKKNPNGNVKLKNLLFMATPWRFGNWTSSIRVRLASRNCSQKRVFKQICGKCSVENKFPQVKQICALSKQ
jgi:hypothetical protein